MNLVKVGERVEEYGDWYYPLKYHPEWDNSRMSGDMDFALSEEIEWEYFEHEKNNRNLDLRRPANPNEAIEFVARMDIREAQLIRLTFVLDQFAKGYWLEIL